MNQTKPTNWGRIKVVILDVDGTLYDQKKLRKKMLFALLSYYLPRPWKLNEVQLLQKFRKEREHRAGTACDNLEEAQYSWCLADSGASTVLLKKVVNQWIFRFPLQYLADCCYPGTKEFLQALRKHQIKIGIYSDYPAHDKLQAMGLEADCIVSSTDSDINSLKPQPDGLLRVAQKLGVRPADCLFIGDRQELDGLCAEKANMPYQIVDKKPFPAFDYYHNLVKELNTSIPTNKSSLKINA